MPTTEENVASLLKANDHYTNAIQIAIEEALPRNSDETDMLGAVMALTNCAITHAVTAMVLMAGYKGEPSAMDDELFDKIAAKTKPMFMELVRKLWKEKFE